MESVRGGFVHASNEQFLTLELLSFLYMLVIMWFACYTCRSGNFTCIVSRSVNFTCYTCRSGKFTCISCRLTLGLHIGVDMLGRVPILAYLACPTTSMH